MNEFIRIMIGDNSNSSYYCLISVEISRRNAIILRDFENEEYDAAWDDLVSTIERNHPRLPADWYINKIYWN